MVRIAAIPAAWLALAWPDPASPGPHSVDELVRPSLVRSIAISPNGKRIAIAYRRLPKEEEVVEVIDADQLGEASAARQAISLGEDGLMSADWVGWGNDSRLLIGLTIRALRAPGGDWASIFSSRRVVAVDPDGTREVVLFSGSRRLLRSSLDLSDVVDYTPKDPTTVVMAAWGGASLDLYRVDIYTGAAEKIAAGSRSTIGWETESGEPALRYDANRRGSVISVHARSDHGKKWPLLVRYRAKEDKEAMQEWEIAGDAPGIGVERPDFAVDAVLAHAAGNELGDLGTEIEDEDFLVLHGGSRWRGKRNSNK